MPPFIVADGSGGRGGDGVRPPPIDWLICYMTKVGLDLNQIFTEGVGCKLEGDTGIGRGGATDGIFDVSAFLGNHPMTLSESL